MRRREFLWSAIGAGVVALGSDCFAEPTESIRVALEDTVGPRCRAAG